MQANGRFISVKRLLPCSPVVRDGHAGSGKGFSAAELPEASYEPRWSFSAAMTFSS
jgi:hypothetical protein